MSGHFRTIPSGKHTKNYGKSPFFMGINQLSMGHFQVRKLLVYQRVMTEFSSPLSFGELPHVSFQLPSACHAECHGYMKTGGMTHPLYWENPSI